MSFESKRVVRRLYYLGNFLRNLFILFGSRDLIKNIFVTDYRTILRMLLMTKLSSEAINFSIYVKNNNTMNFSSDYQDQFVLYYMNSNCLEVSDSFYIDIGAFDGQTKSNSKKLENVGVSGIVVEPNPEAFGKLKNNRQSIARNVGLVQSYSQNDSYRLIVSGEKGITSHLKIQSDLDTGSSSEKVELLTVENFLSQYKTLLLGYKFRYLSIDVEGLDVVLLKEFLVLDFSPELISIEHNHDKKAIKEIRKLANQYKYVIKLPGFFRNEFILVKTS